MINRLGTNASMLGNLSLGYISHLSNQSITSTLNLTQNIISFILGEQFVLTARRGDSFTFPLPTKTISERLGFRGRFKTAETVSYYFNLTDQQLDMLKLYLNYYQFDYFTLNKKDILYLKLTENNERALNMFNRDNQIVLDFDLIKES